MASSSSSSNGCEYGGDCTCLAPPPQGLEDLARCENGQWILIVGFKPQTNQTVIIPQNITVVRPFYSFTSCPPFFLSHSH